MPNFNKKLSDTSVRIGEVRFSYVHVFTPRANEDGTPGKYSAQLLIPKANKEAVKLINDAINAAKEAGKTSKWSGKIPARLTSPLRDGDEEHPEEENYEGMWFMNTSSGANYRPTVKIRADGKLVDPLDQEEFYSGCWGCAVINFYPYSFNGNNGVTAGLNLVLKTRDDKSLAGGMSAEAAFGDLADGDFLD